jgi:hypothetical protein
VLVRRVKQGSTWHPATDNLRGTDVYGTYGTPLSDTTFSIAWQVWGTELLLTTGAMIKTSSQRTYLIAIGCVYELRRHEPVGLA